MPLSIFLPFWTSRFVFILSLLFLWMADAFLISLVFWFCFCSHGDSLTLSSVNDIDHMCGWPHALDIFWSRKWSLNLLLTFFLFSSLSGISVLLWFACQYVSIWYLFVAISFHHIVHYEEKQPFERKAFLLKSFLLVFSFSFVWCVEDFSYGYWQCHETIPEIADAVGVHKKMVWLDIFSFCCFSLCFVKSVFFVVSLRTFRSKDAKSHLTEERIWSILHS